MESSLPSCPRAAPDACGADPCPPMTLDSIINGKQGEFPGLLPLIDVYLGAVDVEVETR